MGWRIPAAAMADMPAVDTLVAVMEAVAGATVVVVAAAMVEAEVEGIAEPHNS